ncbi:MAG: diguanylate cyclase [Lachnobacterium sp.]|nr:diguanylate cyclase [Lachnobacterium sp.]
MERREMYANGRIPRIIFYIAMIAILVVFIAAEIVYPSERAETSQEKNLIYHGTFVWEKEDGTQEKIAVPGKYEVPAGETMTIVTMFPNNYKDTSIAIRSSLQSVRFYVDGKLRTEYDTANTRPFGKDSASRYVFCPTYTRDAGRELKIELTSNTANYSGVVNPVYSGDKADIWAFVFRSNGMESLIALFILFTGIITILFSFALRITYRTKFDIEYLGWCMLMGATWMIGESKLRQLWIPNVSILAALCFIIVMICPLGILLYVDTVQKSRYHRIYRWIELAACINFVVSVTLQLTGKADFIETLPASHVVLSVTFVAIFVTFIRDMLHGGSRDYHLALVGMVIALVSALIEMVSVYFVVTISGLFIGTGLVILLFLNLIRTVRSVRNLERLRQKKELESRRRQTERISLQTIKTLSVTVETKNVYTNGHSQRVADYSALIAGALGWDDKRINNLRNAAYMHDVGMIGIPDSIVNKPTRLTEEEYAIIQRHTLIGADILKDITLIEHVAEVAHYHHERYDGTGYPEGLSGEEIPIEARIVAVADSYDAMNSKRIYRNALEKEKIIEELESCSGTQFDPVIAELFVRLIREGKVDTALLPAEPIGESKMDHYESETTKFISDIMSTMQSQEDSDSYDFLTGLPVRSKGEILIAQMMQEHDGGLVFVDMDNLKKLNDVYGHKAGDRALKLLGNILKDAGDNSIACRLGGDEFLLFLPDYSKDEIHACVKHIFFEFAKAKEDDVELRCADLSAGMSLSTNGATFEKCYREADKALYFVKQNGKGNYMFYHDMPLDRGMSGTGKDLELVAKALQQSGSYTGALDLDYRAFAKVYEYVNSLGERYRHKCYLVMVTMETFPDRMIYIEHIEEALGCMENAIREKIRKVDVCTRFSSMQYLIILFEAQEDRIANVMDRTFAQYNELYGKDDFIPRYEYIPMVKTED